jgi:tetratricopeptide (TPR) repeat protein
LLLQALPKLTAHSPQGISEAIALLDRAIGLSPDYAHALAFAAQCRALRPVLGFSPDIDKDFREAAELTQRALASDPADARALSAAAFYTVLARRDYQTSRDLIDRSLAIDPNSAVAWNMRGWISVWAGENEKGLADFENAMRLSPLDPQWSFAFKHGIATALCWDGRPDEALPWLRRSLQDHPDAAGPHRMLIAVLWLSGRRIEAREVTKRYLEMIPGFSLRRAREISPVRGTPAQEQYFDALRAAGLPE